jgi:hypothetical protein
MVQFLCYRDRDEKKYCGKHILQVICSVPVLWYQDRDGKYIVVNDLLHKIDEVMQMNQ